MFTQKIAKKNPDFLKVHYYELITQVHMYSVWTK
jgi:hypothetical protein